MKAVFSKYNISYKNRKKGKDMKIIVTGGAGFIGTNFLYYVLKKHPENEYICLDKLTYAGNLANLEEALKKPGFRFIKGDIADREFVYKLFEDEKPDMIVNFAAESHVDRSVLFPDEFLKTNVSTRYLQMKSMEIYHLTEKICSLQKLHHLIHQVHILPQRLQQI